MQRKLAIGFPLDSPFVFTSFVDGVLNLEVPQDTRVRWFRGKGWCSSRRHIHICEQAMDWGADLICIVGPDQSFPEDLLVRLVGHIDDGCDAISALVPFRGKGAGMAPFQRMAWRKQGEKFVPIDPDAAALQEIDVIGTGCLMFKSEHLENLPKPWFTEMIDAVTFQRTANQDSRFVWSLRTIAGVHLFVDTTIAIKHAHVFQIDETFPDRFADWADGSGEPEICNYK